VEISNSNKIKVSIAPETLKDLQEKASQIILNLTERALVNQLDRFFSNRFEFPEKFLRSALILIVREFNKNLDIPLHSISSINQESRFEKLMDLRLLMNEFFVSVISDQQAEILNAINEFFAKYLTV
jgi:hypothetical protein